MCDGGKHQGLVRSALQLLIIGLVEEIAQGNAHETSVGVTQNQPGFLLVFVNGQCEQFARLHAIIVGSQLCSVVLEEREETHGNDVALFTVREGIVAEGVRGDSKDHGSAECIGCACGFRFGDGGRGFGARRRCCGFVLRTRGLNLFRMREGTVLVLLFVEPLASSLFEIGQEFTFKQHVFGTLSLEDLPFPAREFDMRVEHFHLKHFFPFHLTTFDL